MQSPVMLPQHGKQNKHHRTCPAAVIANCTYTCRAGDSLEATALALGTTAEALQAVNGGAELSVLLPGQVLRLPAGAACAGGCIQPAITVVVIV
jgi:hypothetical protein